jgi:hypothetical protein
MFRNDPDPVTIIVEWETKRTLIIVLCIGGLLISVARALLKNTPMGDRLLPFWAIPLSLSLWYILAAINTARQLSRAIYGHPSWQDSTDANVVRARAHLNRWGLFVRKV